MLPLTELCCPQFSADGERIYFLSAEWATSHALCVLDLSTRRAQFICDAIQFEVVPDGEYRGDLIVLKHKYFVDSGSYDWYWLVTPDGKEVGPIGPEENMETFKNQGQ